MELNLRSILAALIDIDIELFLFLNGIHSPTWDVIFFWITGKTLWIPLYIFLCYLSYKKFSWRVVYVLLFIGLVILVSDQSSVKLFKNVFERLRPCHNPEISALVHTIRGHCGGRFGFVSSHATNSFAIAVFVGLILRSRHKYLFTALLLWAALVSYSRVYVGVHFPADILGGALLGTLAGLIVFGILKICNTKFKLKMVEL